MRTIATILMISLLALLACEIVPPENQPQPSMRILKYAGLNKISENWEFEGSVAVPVAGAIVPWGDQTYGTSELDFPYGAFSEETTVQYKWISDGVYASQFYPSGVFAEPATLRLSYEGSDYSDETKIKILHHTAGGWLPTVTVVDTVANIAWASISSFSQYALAEED